MFSDAHLDGLRAAVRDRRLIVVAGAGVSRAAGLPLWGDLLRERMPAFLRGRGPEGQRVADQMLAVADFPLHAAGIWWEWIEQREGLEAIASFFDDTFLQAASPTAAHRRIVDLCRLACPCVITTNFDRLFEMHGPDLRVKTQVSQSLGYSLAPGARRAKFLMKLHGTAENLETVVLTAAQYARQAERQACAAFLSAIQLNFSLLFVGYGGSDPDLNELRRQLVARFSGNVSNLYMLLDRPDPTLVQALGSTRVVVAQFDGRSGYGVVDHLLDLLLAEARQQAPIHLEEEMRHILEGARGYYTRLSIDACRHNYDNVVRDCLRQTEDADRPRGTVGNRARFFMDKLRTNANEGNIVLPPTRNAPGGARKGRLPRGRS